MLTGFWWGNLKHGDCVGDVHRRIILKNGLKELGWEDGD